jgi:hypothetical protein
MKQMSDLNDLIATNSINAFNQGVQTGVRQEQERIIKLLEQRTDIIDEFAYAIELIKGEK